MASLYKKPIITHNPKTGQKVKARSKKWWGRFRDYRGLERRVPLARDKTAAQAMLNELVLKEERRAAGHIDPCEEQAGRLLKQHVDDFEHYLRHKGNSAQYVNERSTRVQKIVAGCKWRLISDLSASRVQRYLAERRKDKEDKRGLSIQTSNHYLRAIKQFSRWLVRDRRAHDDPLAHISMLNARVDRRHDRRALSVEEFTRLVEAATTGPEVICLSGLDRAMMYILSAWTGYRKAEIGSLTKRSIRLDDDPPTVTVAAAYSKRKRQDTQVLHSELAAGLRGWLTTKGHLPDGALLFPVSGNVPGGVERRGAKMMKKDLAAARKKWIEEAQTRKEKAEREASDFLRYKDSASRFADFHSNRHTFITNLEHVGVSPRTAQSLARHCDIRLTMDVYTHIGLHDQRTAIELLPAPPELMPSVKGPNCQANGNGHLDALWAQLPENVKAELLATVKAGTGSDLVVGLGG